MSETPDLDKLAAETAPVTFFKKRVPIKAMHFVGTNTKECCQFIQRSNIGSCTPGECIEICTLEGSMRASVGDWIICGVKGEFYPCKPDIFEETYEATPTATAPLERVRELEHQLREPHPARDCLAEANELLAAKDKRIVELEQQLASHKALVDNGDEAARILDGTDYRWTFGEGCGEVVELAKKRMADLAAANARADQAETACDEFAAMRESDQKKLAAANAEREELRKANEQQRERIGLLSYLPIGAARAEEVKHLNEIIDAVWKDIEAGFEIEPREFFEKAWHANGFKHPLLMALHYIWKREPKVAQLREQLAAAEQKLADIARGGDAFIRALAAEACAARSEAEVRAVDLEKKCEQLQRERDEAVKAMSDWASRCGQAEGRLMASEMVGVVSDWQRKCEQFQQQLTAAQKQVERLKQKWRAFKATVETGNHINPWGPVQFKSMDDEAAFGEQKGESHQPMRSNHELSI